MCVEYIYNYTYIHVSDIEYSTSDIKEMNMQSCN